MNAAKKLFPISTTPPLPRNRVCEKMCDACPFRPDGTGLARNHADFPRMLANAKAGLPFYCHDTVLFDKRTEFDINGVPAPSFQNHFELCQGAHREHLATWEAATRKGLLMGHLFDFPHPVRPKSVPPYRGKVVDVRETPTETLILLEGKKVFVPWWKCTEVVLDVKDARRP